MSKEKTRGFRYKGFIIVCASCGEASATVESRQDGVDFQCRKCGNKLLMRPGDVMRVPVMKQGSSQVAKVDKAFVKDQTEQFKLDIEIEDLQNKEIPQDDWPNEILDEFFKRQGLMGEDS